MSVPKGKRGISDMEFFKLSNDLYNTFENWLLRDFGIRDKVRKSKNTDELLEIAQFPLWFIEHKRKIILAILDEYMDALITANSIYPTNYAELLERRNYQNRAVAKLEYLEQFLQRSIVQLPLSKSKSVQYFDLIEHTISIVKLWRKSNSKIKKILDAKLKASVQLYKKNNDITTLLGWGLSNIVIEHLLSNKGGKEEVVRI
jgi:hypothetical protein